MAATASAPPVDLIFLLSQASHALQTEMTAALEKINATPRAYCVLGNARRFAPEFAAENTDPAVFVFALP